MTDSALLQQTLASSVTWNRARLKLLTRLDSGSFASAFGELSAIGGGTGGQSQF